MTGGNRYNIWLIILAFIAFQIFWFSFNLSYLNFDLNPDNRSFIFKRQAAPAIGFIISLVTALWIFPVLILRRRWAWLLLIMPLFLLASSWITMEVSRLLYDGLPDTGNILISPRVNRIAPGTSVNWIPARPAILPSALFRNALLNSLIYLLLGLGAGYMGDWFIKERRTRTLEKEKLQAELTLLRYQLNPHFFFNTLNDIYYLAIINSDKTADAIVKVSGMLRYVLNEKKDFVLLEKEIAYLKEFIGLQEFRFPDQRIAYQENMDTSVSQCEIPPLLLITFIENAFKHGEPGTKEDPLRIRLDLKNKILNYQVINKINPVNSKDDTTGIGLPNLTRRLFLLYADRYEMTTKESEGYYTAYLKIELT